MERARLIVATVGRNRYDESNSSRQRHTDFSCVDGQGRDHGTRFRRWIRGGWGMGVRPFGRRAPPPDFIVAPMSVMGSLLGLDRIWSVRIEIPRVDRIA
jgi:hypothetical protein